MHRWVAGWVGGWLVAERQVPRPINAGLGVVGGAGNVLVGARRRLYGCDPIETVLAHHRLAWLLFSAFTVLAAETMLCAVLCCTVLCDDCCICVMPADQRVRHE